MVFPLSFIILSPKLPSDWNTGIKLVVPEVFKETPVRLFQFLLPSPIFKILLVLSNPGSPLPRVGLVPDHAMAVSYLD